jgi:hypothetical protein
MNTLTGQMKAWLVPFASSVEFEFETNSRVSVGVAENKIHKGVARPGRLELPTLCFEGRRSIQLSYGRTALKFDCKSFRLIRGRRRLLRPRPGGRRCGPGSLVRVRGDAAEGRWGRRKDGELNSPLQTSARGAGEAPGDRFISKLQMSNQNYLGMTSRAK